MAEYIDNAIYKMEQIIKKGKPTVLRKELKAHVLKPATDDIPDYERDKICKTASEEAKNPVARVKKKLADKIRKDLNFN